MKKTLMFAAAAAVIGFASASVPASAASAGTAVANPLSTELSSQYMERRTVIRRGGPRCMTKVVRTRGPMGRVVVRKTRVCR